MWRVIKWLVTGDWHLHCWEREAHGAVTVWENGHDTKRQVAQYRICRCRVCGRYKRFNMPAPGAEA